MNIFNDKNFLYKLDRQKNKVLSVKITLLTFDELPVESIEGRVSAGSISVDGASAIRRTCNLTLIRDDQKMLDYNWSINKKFKLEVGVQNNVDIKYPDIIWFPQGIFILTAFSARFTTSGYSISISGKDKMCLLNGDIGGSIPHAIKASQVEHEQYIYSPITISGIQYNIKNNIPQQYYYKEGDIYYLDEHVIDNLNIYEHYVRESAIIYEDLEIKDIIKNIVIKFGNEKLDNVIINDFNDNALELLTYSGSKTLYMFKDTATNVIQNMTINDHHVVYLPSDTDNTIWNQGKEVSSFSEVDYDLLLTYDEGIHPVVVKTASNSPNTYTIVKLTMGDMAGYRPTALTYPGRLITKVGDTVTSILDTLVKVLGTYEYFYDIYGRFIFQKKRIYSQTHWDPIIVSNENNEQFVQNLMQAEMSSYSFDDGLLLSGFNNTPQINQARNDFSIWGERTSPSGVKTLIHYRYAIARKPTSYTPIKLNKDKDRAEWVTYKTSEGWDWRELIYRMAEDYYAYAMRDPTFFSKIISYNKDENGMSLYPTGYTGYECFYEDLLGFWRDIHSSEKGENGWADVVKKNPEMINFWFDFLDNTSFIGNYTIQSIGDRTKVINDNKITSIYSRGVPDVLFVSHDEYEELVNQKKLTSSYTYIILPLSLLDAFTVSGTYKSAKEVLDDTMNTYALCAESASITILPVYHLEPNSIVSIHDDTTGIAGNYVITKFSVPLTHNGSMSLTATKKIDAIY